jgi:mono/diheme cytochrome c family protein
LIPIKVAEGDARDHYAARRTPGGKTSGVGEERTMRRVAAVAMLAGLAVMAVMGAGAASAQEDDAAAAVESGKDIFVRHCALCHGLDGSGDGPLAAALQIAPANLTRIAVEHNDKFPSAKIADVIRNGGGVLGHGSTAMLAWGLYFSEKRKPEVARARIKALVDYIQSIQQQ